MIFKQEWGWIRDHKTKRLYLYLPAYALEDMELLEDYLNLLAENHPDDKEAVN